MSKSAADKLREQMAAARAKTAAKPAAPAVAVDQAVGAASVPVEDVPAPRVRQAAPVQTKPVRSTVDLSPVHHHDLDAWQSETAREIGQTRVTRQDVLRAAVALVLTDETVARRVRAQIRADKEST